MAALTRPWSIRVLELVDRGITDLEMVIVLTIPFVPPGRAYRQREYRRLHSSGRRAPDHQPTCRPFTISEAHRVGARDVVRDCIWAMVQRGVLVREGDTIRRPSSET